MKNITKEAEKMKKKDSTILLRTLIFMGVVAISTTVVTTIIEFGIDLNDILPFLEGLISGGNAE